MEPALACIYCALVAMALQVVVLRISARHPAMWYRRNYFRLMAVIWSATPFAKICYIDQIAPPADSLEHEAVAREIADMLTTGHLVDLTPYLAIGNSAYRFLLGVFYFATGAPEVVVYAVNGALGFLGLMFLLDVLCQHTHCRRLPLVAIFVTGLLPSALLWTTANLKEGLVLWGICATLYLTVPARSFGGRAPRILPFIGLMAVASQRPHIAAAWLLAIAAGVSLQSKRVGLFLGCVFAAVLSFVLLSYVAPDLFASAMSDGVSATLSQRYDSLSSSDSLNGAALTGANPIPVLSGLLLILFRPWPFEIENSVTFLVGLEVWMFALLGFFIWKSAKQRRKLLLQPAIVTHIVALLMLSFYFSYMFNMGLVARQRLMCFPAVLFLYFFPLLARQDALRSAPKSQASFQPRPVAGLIHRGQPQLNR